MKFTLLILLTCLSVALAGLPQRGLIHEIQKGVAGPNPYIFLTVPKGRSQTIIQGFEVIEERENKKQDFDADEEIDNDDEDMSENDSEDADDDQQMNDEEDEESNDSIDNREKEKKSDYNDDDDDDDNDNDNDEFDNVMQQNLKLRKSNFQIKNAKATQMMVSRENAGAIMVPDQIIEIEGQSVIDEKTGKSVFLLPRSILDSIPDGSVVALMERSADDEAEERANRVIVRRRRKGVRRNIKRRRVGNGNKRYRVVRRDGNKRRNNYRRKNVQVVRVGDRRGGNKRRVVRRRIYFDV